MNSREVKILWISDIHFSEKYAQTFTEKADFKKYFTSFNAKIREIIEDDPENTFDYIFLTGDLAQAGIKTDYDLLFEKFLKPLLDVFLQTGVKKPKVIAIPGNHDVDWSKTDFLSDFVQGIIPALKKNPDRSAYLEERPDEFRKLFSDYSKFMLETLIEADNGAYKDFFALPDTVSFVVSGEYRSHRLFGYIIDHENRMIINLLNTAWFSLGGKFNQILARNEADNPGWNAGEISILDIKDIKKYPKVQDLIVQNVEDRLREVLNKKEFISEYSNQVTGINIFEHEKLMKVLRMYSEYFVITCMHHPFNWLQWTEQYSFEKENEKTNAKRLSKLIKHSNVILTGHEHVPKEVNGDIKNEGYLLLKSGCFLFDNQHYGVNLENGWFSVLHIDPDRAKVRQDKHFYFTTGTKAAWDEIKSEDDDNNRFKLTKANFGYDLLEERRKEIIKMVGETTLPQLESFLNDLYIPGAPLSVALKEIYRDKNVIACQAKRQTGNELCLFMLTPDAYTEISSDAFGELIIKLVQESKINFNTIRFIVLDLFIDEPDTSKMKPEDIEKLRHAARAAQLQFRVTIADDMFDIMRHGFFYKFEEKLKNGETLDPLFDVFKDCRFINTILPYWVAENIWRCAKPLLLKS